MGSTAVPAAPGAAQAAAPTQDYSAQWAAYYRSMGKIGEAEAIEAQARLKQVGRKLKATSKTPVTTEDVVRCQTDVA